MNKPSKCKNCEWFGKPYWSVINPCDRCPREIENNNIEIITRWQDPALDEKDKEIERLNNIIKKIEKYIDEELEEFEEDDDKVIDEYNMECLKEYIQELKKVNEDK